MKFIASSIQLLSWICFNVPDRLPVLCNTSSGGVWLETSVYVSNQKVGGSIQLHSAWFDDSLLSAGHSLAPKSATDWFTEACVMCYHIYVIMHIKDPYSSLHALNRDVNIIKKNTSDSCHYMFTCCTFLVPSWKASSEAQIHANTMGSGVQDTTWKACYTSLW